MQVWHGAVNQWDRERVLTGPCANRLFQLSTIFSSSSIWLWALGGAGVSAASRISRASVRSHGAATRSPSQQPGETETGRQCIRCDDVQPERRERRSHVCIPPKYRQCVLLAEEPLVNVLVIVVRFPR